MHNTFISSAIYSIRSKGSVSFSFNDYSYLLNERFDRNPLQPSSLSSSCCGCCSCCAYSYSTHRVPINPSLLYGLRQSTLLQWPASKRLVLGGGDRYCYRLPVYGLDRGCYEVSCSPKERSGCNRSRRRRNGGCSCMVSEGDREVDYSGGFDDAEAMLSLLSEDVGEECFGVRGGSGYSFERVEVEKRGDFRSRERNVSSLKRVEVAKGENMAGRERNLSLSKRVGVEKGGNIRGKERNVSSSKRVEVEKRGSRGSDCYSGKKRNVESGLQEGNSRHEYELVTLGSREEDYRHNEDRGTSLKRENRTTRKGGSSCSSYYSFSSLGDFESDVEVQDKQGRFVEESSSGYRDSGKNVEDRFEGQVAEDFKRHKDDAKGHEEISEHRNTAVGNGVEWDWRKKSEKKLTEISVEETQSRKESSAMRLRVSDTHESNYGMSSSSHKKIYDEDNSTLAVNMDKGTRKQYSQTQIGETRYERKNQEHTALPEFPGSDVEPTSQLQKRSSDREGNLVIAANLVHATRDEHGKTVDLITAKDNIKRNSQQLTDMLEIQDVNTERTSNWQRQSDTRMKSRKENTALVLTSVEATEDRRHQTGERIIGQIDSRRNSQQVTETSEFHDSNIEKTSIKNSGTRLKNREENLNLVSNLDTQITFEKRMFNPKRNLTSKEKPVWEARERDSQTDETVVLIKSRKEAQRPTKLSSFQEKTSEESSSFQASLNLVSQGQVQQIKVEKGEKRSSEAILLPPQSQLVPRGSLHFETTSGNATQEVSGENSESGSSVYYAYSEGKTPSLHNEPYGRDGRSEIYGEPLNFITPEDALGSADRLEKSSMQYSQTDETVVLIKSRKEAQRPTKLSSFQEKTSEESSCFQASLNLVSQGQVQQIEVEKGEKRSSEAILLPPQSQLVPRGSLHVETTSGNATQEVSGETSESGSSVYYTYSEGRTPSLHNEPYGRDGHSEIYGEPLNFITPEDALGSADRLEKSSMQYVGEFVEKVRHEVLTSEVQKEKKDAQIKLVSGESYRQKSSSQYGSEDLQLKDCDLRCSSGGSGTKGPSDDMWDVTDSSIQQTPQAEGPEKTTTTENAVVKRSGRSLWGIIADVVRLKWVSHAESPDSVRRLGGRSLPDKSVSSEACFSGCEHEENSNENLKREKRRSMPPEATSSDQLLHGKSSSQSQGEVSDRMRSKDKTANLRILESGSALKGNSSASGEENLGFNEDANAMSFRGSPSGMEIVELSLPLPSRGIRRSPVVEEISNTSETAASGSGSTELMEEPVSASLTEIPGTKGKDGELIQRKLQRIKQVPRDRFDEWEDAYKVESEQRRIDEMFMREALLEAQKAADTWEVPVGAVLVQHGKIIARGCNLVEELRDSTAHAEMICIREASNLLQSWRLVETTLYVTLEPCPMCAGAILQARINTLVWGAPNKLLGADGSWIRLFPDGGEGGNDSELSDKPAAPVHPFHPKMTIRRGVLGSECAGVMQQFFQLRRKKKEKKEEPPPSRSSSLRVSHSPSKFLTKIHDIFHVVCL